MIYYKGNSNIYNLKSKEITLCDRLILKKVSGNISYIHITYPEYLKNIIDKGLKKSSGETTNFKVDSIYVADISDSVSINALAELSEDFTCRAEEDDFVVIHGTYNGEYLKCIGTTDNNIWGYNIGFVGLLNEKGSKITKYDMIKGINLKRHILWQQKEK